MHPLKDSFNLPSISPINSTGFRNNIGKHFAIPSIPLTLMTVVWGGVTVKIREDNEEMAGSSDRSS